MPWQKREDDLLLLSDDAVNTPKLESDADKLVEALLAKVDKVAPGEQGGNIKTCALQNGKLFMFKNRMKHTRERTHAKTATDHHFNVFFLCLCYLRILRSHSL